MESRERSVRWRQSTTVETIVLAAGGLAVLATARLRWIAEGAGSTFNGQELAGTLRNGALVPDFGSWVAAGIYILVALGGLLLASSGFSGRLVASARLAAAVTVGAAFVLAAIRGWFPLSRWAAGPTLIVGACAVAIVVSARQLVRTE